MKTLHLHAEDPEAIARAAEILRRGGLVAFATETVYGLGANALSLEAVSGIFRAKERPAWDPLIVHLPDAEQLGSVANVEGAAGERVRALAGAFWPGPLTMLLPRTSAVPDAVTAGRPLVGVRVPAHAAAQALLRAAQIPVAAPSANRFGHISPTTAEHVLADLGGRIDAVLDAGPCRVGLESTVVDPATSPITVYRAGAVSVEQIAKICGVNAALFQASGRTAQDRSAMPSPGVGLRHYAPKVPLHLTHGDPDAVSDAAEALKREGKRAGILLPRNWPVRADADAVVQPWGEWNDAESLANSLFAGLRLLESSGAEALVCPLPEPGGLRDALRDRLVKAART